MRHSNATAGLSRSQTIFLVRVCLILMPGGFKLGKVFDGDLAPATTLDLVLCQHSHIQAHEGQFTLRSVTIDFNSSLTPCYGK